VLSVFQHEADVFEITDFTTASEWERFVSRVEEVLNDWKLTESSGDFTTGSWEEESKEIHFADFKFLITHYFLKKELKNDDEQEKQLFSLLESKITSPLLIRSMQDLLCMQNDFPPRAHCLVRWYGLQEFVVITPATNSEAIISESKCNLLLSSVSISLSNSGCQVPVFVQIQQKWRRIYAGECQGPGVRTDFEIVHLRRVPSQYNHLSGLLDIFKSKIGCNMLPLPPVDIAIRFTYILQDWQQYSWPQQPPDFDALLGGEVGGVEIGKLPFGACEESISELHLAATWPHVTEGLVVDNDVYSDLDPLQAPHWSVRVRMAENPQCLLGDYLTEFFRLCCRKDSVEDVLGKGLTEEEGKDTSDISSALSKLTEPAAPVPISRLSVSSMVHSARKRIHRRRHIHESPLSNEVLNSILLYLFPDAAVEKSDTCGDRFVSLLPLQSLFLQLKSAPPDSLTYRLALCVFLVNYSYGGLAGVAHLWQEFVLELRYRWENTCLVYGLEAGPPDLRCCLLHQKLQMLNCCIERRRARDEARKAQEATKDKHSKEAEPEHSISASSSAKETSQGKSWESWSDSEDEFYECLSEQGEEGPQTEAGHNGASRAEGRLHPYNNLTLLHSSEPLFVPVTQEPAPMTEDQLEEQSEVLAKLGTSAEGTHLRARMQSACLLSDMESFKAANPGCVLEDFVRWYSPRDYVLEEVVDEKGNKVTKGELSTRMKITGNMWVEAWETARVTPARRQKRLFDDTKEAEKVLHYFAMQKPGDVASHLFPCVINAALLKLKQEGEASLNKKFCFFFNAFCLQEFMKQLAGMETAIAQARSLKAKFTFDSEDQNESESDFCVSCRFVSSLLEEPEVEVTGAGQGPAGRIIHRLFLNAQQAALLPSSEDDMGGDKKDFPSPAGREILLRTCVPRPAPYSRALPQRLFCVLMREEFRLAGAFSSDTSFF
uniref:Rab3 GTPase-activating protein catalytic subunit n=1 Tax=Oryzias melastigma TaxID=30732 RepID=A0A3B3CJN1_ORYME